jgi:glucokinase
VNDQKLNHEAQSATVMLRQKYQRGVYRVIRDPEGVISFWSIEGLEQNPFSLQFANRGRISSNIADMPDEFVRVFIDYVRKTLKK